jgi:hypothetical protein
MTETHLSITPIINRQATNNDKETQMRTYEITYLVTGSGAGTVRETVTAASDYNARMLIYAKFPKGKVLIMGSRQVS